MKNYLAVVPYAHIALDLGDPNVPQLDYIVKECHLHLESYSASYHSRPPLSVKKGVARVAVPPGCLHKLRRHTLFGKVFACTWVLPVADLKGGFQYVRSRKILNHANLYEWPRLFILLKMRSRSIVPDVCQSFSITRR